jgi:hypothetical protein
VRACVCACVRGTRAVLRVRGLLCVRLCACLGCVCVCVAACMRVCVHPTCAVWRKINFDIYLFVCFPFYPDSGNRICVVRKKEKLV